MPPSSHTNPVSGPTLNSFALAQLRSDIIACRLMPNERLRVESLRERYDMGTSPIREALMRLEAEGLVALEQNKGFRVSEVSRENLLDLMNTRIEIESIALRWAIGKGSVEWEADLLSSFHRLSRQSKFDPAGPSAISEAWSKAHAAFHTTLVSTCSSPTLLSICARLFEQAERYVALSIMSDGPLRDDVSEHKQIMRAALSRDIEKTVELNRAHIGKTLEKVSASLGNRATPVQVRGLRKRAPK